MDRIDEPRDVALRQHTEDTGDPILDLILGVAGACILPLGIMNGIRQQFSESSRKERLTRLLQIFNTEFDLLRKSFEELADQQKLAKA